MSESLYDIQNFGIEDLNAWAHPGGGTETIEVPSGQGLVEDQFEAHLQGLHIAYKEPLAHALASLANKLDENGKEKVASQVDSIIQKLAEDTRLAELANMLNNIGAFFERHYSMIESAKAIVPDERMADFQKLVATNGAAIQKLVLHFNKLKSGFNTFKGMESIPDEHYVQYKSALDKIQVVARGLEYNIRNFLQSMSAKKASVSSRLEKMAAKPVPEILNRIKIIESILEDARPTLINMQDFASFQTLVAKNFSEIRMELSKPIAQVDWNLIINIVERLSSDEYLYGAWSQFFEVDLEETLTESEFNKYRIALKGILYYARSSQEVLKSRPTSPNIHETAPSDAREKQEPQQFTNSRDQELLFDLIETIQAIEKQAKLHQMRGNSIATTMSDEDGKRFEQLVRNDIAKHRPTLSRLKHVQMQVEQLKRGNSLPYEVYADYKMALSQIRSAVDKMVANVDVFAKQVQLERKM